MASSASQRDKRTSLHMNFFKDLMDKAFENDVNLSTDKSQGQLEGPNDEDDAFAQNLNAKTEVQKKWLASQQQQQQQQSQMSQQATQSAVSTTTTSFGAPLTIPVLGNTQWNLALYLTGVPDFDPSSSLFGSRVNISTRNEPSSLANDGFAIGTDTLPPQPSVIVTITLQEDGTCLAQPSSFTKGTTVGEWKLSPDGRMVRFSMDVVGYQRTVKTTGSIQNVYWSDREAAESTSQATYSIAPGWVYGEVSVGYGSQPGTLIMGDMGGGVSGILRIEKKQGLLGAGTKIFPCGKFSAEMVMGSDE